MDNGIVYEEKKLRCSVCDGEIDECVDCGKPFHIRQKVYCVLHTTVDDFNYIHLCEDCKVKEETK